MEPNQSPGLEFAVRAKPQPGTGLAQVESELHCWVSQTIFALLLFFYVHFPVVHPWHLATSFKKGTEEHIMATWYT